MSKSLNRAKNALLILFYWCMLLISWPLFLTSIIWLYREATLLTIDITLTTSIAVYFITREAYRRIKPIMAEGVAPD